MAMTTVLDWAEDRLKEQIGLNKLRNAETPNPKDGFRLGKESTRASENATFDVPFMLSTGIKEMCTCSLGLAQVGIRYRTPFYDFLVTLLTEDHIDALKS